MERLLIIGANSYTGARIYTDLKKSFDTVIGTYHSNPIFPELIQLDIMNKSDVVKVIQKVKPTIIIHVAANASAKWCDAHPEEAKKINEDGTSNIVMAANEMEAKIIYISTFYAKNPVNMYEKTKFAAEEIVKNTRAGFTILRPSMIFGFSPNTINDRPYNRLLKNIVEKTPAIYDNHWQFQQTWIGHISEVIREIIQREIWSETIPMATEELKSRYDVAKDILLPFGITAIPTNEHILSRVVIENQEKLKELQLPYYTYHEFIEKVRDETAAYLKGRTASQKNAHF